MDVLASFSATVERGEGDQSKVRYIAELEVWKGKKTEQQEGQAKPDRSAQKNMAPRRMCCRLPRLVLLSGGDVWELQIHEMFSTKAKLCSRAYPQQRCHRGTT